MVFTDCFIMGMLDDVFEVLETATRLEATGVNRIEAATKVGTFVPTCVK
jgi:hypothetical protein